MSDEKVGPVPGEDAFDRALRELTEGSAGAARYREPSAAERHATARKLSKQAARQAKATEKAIRAGSRKHAKSAAQTASSPEDGWRGAYRYDAPAAGSRRRRAGRRMVRSVAVVAVIVVIAGAAWFAQSRGFFSHGGAGTGNDTQPITNGALPSQILGSEPAGPPADPFASTPADSWANGAAGIVVPAATAHGSFSASQVAKAFAMTRQFLIAQNLDPVTLAGGAPTAFANLLIPGQRKEFIDGLNKMGTDKAGATISTRQWVTSFAPGTTTLIGKAIKVHGTMTASATTGTTGQPELHVNVNYRFVYPVEPPKDPAGWMRVITIMTGYVEFGNWQTATTNFAPWSVLSPSFAGARCDVHDGYIHPAYPTAPADTTPEKGVVSPYSTAAPPDTNSNCFATTGGT